MNRLMLGAIFAAMMLACGAPRVSAAPVPKDAGKADPTPDLKVVFDTVSKAVKDEKWPAADDEKKLTGTARTVFERMLKAADQKERALPVDFAKLTKADVTKDFKRVSITNAFVIAENVRGTSAENSIIFASGNVQLTSATNCLIVAQNVSVTGTHNCTIIAGEYTRVTTDSRSVLVAGQWIRATGMVETICHVLRPSGLPSPKDRPGGKSTYPAIQTNGAKNVIYLNERADTAGSAPNDQTYLPQKNPIAK